MEDKKFKCGECDKTFMFASGLSVHKRTHINPDLSFVCTHCSKAYLSQSGLKRHIVAKHQQIKKKKVTVRKTYQCDLCDNLYNRRDSLTRHKKAIHSGFKVKCEWCDKIFNRTGQLNRHVKMIHQNYRYKCTLCPATFCSFSALQRHKFKHSCPEGFRCETCGKLYTSKISLTSHGIHVHNEQVFSCNSCGESFEKIEVLEKHKEECLKEKDKLQQMENSVCQEEPELTCPLCQVNQTSLEEQSAHLQTHSKEEFIKKMNVGYACIICPNVKRIQRYEIRRHVSCVHFHKNHLCNICGKLFNSSSKLKQHILAHERQCRYTCPVCDAKIKKYSEYKNHMKVHGVFYTCIVCSTDFATQSHLDDHLRSVHTAFVCMTCNLCGLQYLSGLRFRNHLFKHTGMGHFCDVCFKTFAEPERLETHKTASHLKCEKCKLWFIDEECRELHMKFKHAIKGPRKRIRVKKVKSLQCVYCNKDGLSKMEFQKHRRIHALACHECRIVLKSKTDFNDHMQTMHHWNAKIKLNKHVSNVKAPTVLEETRKKNNNISETNSEHLKKSNLLMTKTKEVKKVTVEKYGEVGNEAAWKSTNEDPTKIYKEITVESLNEWNPEIAVEVILGTTGEETKETADNETLESVGEAILETADEVKLETADERTLKSTDEGSLKATDEWIPKSADEGTPETADEGTKKIANEGNRMRILRLVYKRNEKALNGWSLSTFNELDENTSNEGTSATANEKFECTAKDLALKTSNKETEGTANDEKETATYECGIHFCRCCFDSLEKLKHHITYRHKKCFYGKILSEHNYFKMGSLNIAL